MEKDKEIHKVRVKAEIMMKIKEIDEETKRIEEGGCDIESKI